jgi:hypothetical protein
MNLHVTVDADTPRGTYLAAAARLRGVSSTHLLRNVVAKVLDDQLILAVMDDAERPRPPAKGQARRWRDAGLKF